MHLTTFEAPACDVDLRAGTLRVAVDDGAPIAAPFLWWRHNAPAPDSHFATGENRSEPFRIDADVRPLATARVDGELRIEWSDGHTSLIPARWLHERNRPEAPRRRRFLTSAGIDELPRMRYADIRTSRAALREWLAQIRDLGFAMLEEVPPVPGVLEEIVSLFGFITETNYGKVFDVRNVVDPINTAYTMRALSIHTDNPYRDPPPSLQLLHCIRSTANGGESTASDLLRCAETLRDERPEDFALLSRIPLTARYRNSDTFLQATAPVISLDAAGEPSIVRFSDRHIDPLDPCRHDPDEMSRYYAAYRRFGALANGDRHKLRFKLGPGSLYVVDNWRWGHGREAYHETDRGERHLRGCYAGIDGLLSTLRVLERETP